MLKITQGFSLRYLAHGFFWKMAPKSSQLLHYIFGSTDEDKRGTCDFAAFMSYFGSSVISFTLAAISCDRFLFIVKPHLHKQFVRPWVALTLTIAIWILSALLETGPFLDIGHYSYDDKSGFCSLVGVDLAPFVAILVVVFFVVGTIFITSLWTFCFTRSYFKAQSVIAGEGVYASKKKRLFWSIWKHVTHLWGTLFNHSCRLPCAYLYYIGGSLYVGLRSIFQDGGRFYDFQTLITLSSYVVKPYKWLR